MNYLVCLKKGIFFALKDFFDGSLRLRGSFFLRFGLSPRMSREEDQMLKART